MSHVKKSHFLKLGSTSEIPWFLLLPKGNNNYILGANFHVLIQINEFWTTNKSFTFLISWSLFSNIFSFFCFLLFYVEQNLFLWVPSSESEFPSFCWSPLDSHAFNPNNLLIFVQITPNSRKPISYFIELEYVSVHSAHSCLFVILLQSRFRFLSLQAHLTVHSTFSITSVSVSCPFSSMFTWGNPFVIYSPSW